MKIKHILLLIMLILSLSYGCSKDTLKRSAFESLQHVSHDRNENDLHEYKNEVPDYDDYQQERERGLKNE